MGGGTSKLRVLIPTTAGPAEVLLLTEEDPVVGRSVACIGGTTATADIAAGYNAFVSRPTGVVESLFGHSCYRLDVSAAIDAGTSWQLGVLAAHALHAQGRLAQENEPADGVMWATGSVRTVDLTVGGVSHVPEKIANSLPRLRQERQAGRQVLVAVPAQNAADLTAEHASSLASCGIEVIHLDRVQPLWDALSIKVPEASKRMAAIPAGASRARATTAPRRRHTIAATMAALLLAGSAGGYLLLRSATLHGNPHPVAQASNVLVPEEVPFLSKARQSEIRDLYLPAPDYKALALSERRAFFASAQKDEEAAMAAALAACQVSGDFRADQGGCDLYASGTTVVMKKGRPPMPPQPWFVHDPLVERAVATDVSLARTLVLKQYVGPPGSKALALGPRGHWHAYFAEINPEEAARRALERCGYDAGVACMIIAIDDSFVVPIPRSAKIVGLFRPGALTTLSEQGREEMARRLSTNTTGWSAVAIGSGARFGLELGAQSEDAAVNGALQACDKEAGDCKVAAIGPFLVER